MTGWPARLPAMAFGGDYNPEQWPEEVWQEDLQLMKDIGVSVVTLGVFSWALLQPAEGVFDFEQTDRILEAVASADLRVVLATPTAAPPAWLARAYPDSRPVTASGRTLGIGARESFCPSSADYRRLAREIAGALARRYRDYEPLALWHVNNELGAHVGPCYCPTSVAAFRSWLLTRYGDLAGLNEAWQTAVWGQRYHDWEEVTAPTPAPMPVNPAQQLDFRRFSSQEYLACYLNERDELLSVTPGVPVTTNLMANNCIHTDYWQWGPSLDVIANDHYLIAEHPRSHIDLSMSAGISRSLGEGRPWLLMEHSTSSVNWQERNLAKDPGELRRNSLAHVAHGADGVLFFQWRASRAGAEKFHSAMLPHSGTRSRVWAELSRLGADLQSLVEVAGSRVVPDVAVVWDWENWWAGEFEFKPSVDVDHVDRVLELYSAVWDHHLTADFVPPEGDWSRYPVVVAPSLYLLSDAGRDRARAYVEGGGTLLVWFFSGMVDQFDVVPEGPYPGQLRDVLGVWVDEFHPLAAGVRLRLDDGSRVTVWSEAVRTSGAEAVLRFVDGPDAGGPALTRHRLGAGTAWYLSCYPDAPGLQAVVARVLREAGVSAPEAPVDLERVVRRDADHDYVFLLNHTSAAVEIAERGTDLLTGVVHEQPFQLAGGDVAVLRRPSRAA